MDEGVDNYRYDPSNPTPALGGAQFSPLAGPRDNRKLEARPDVLTFTTPPLSQPVEIIGQVRLQLYVKSSLDYTDFFGRLCDVFPNGRSINICDGLFRVRPGKVERQLDGSMCIEIDMWATAYHFKSGHRIRLQVSSGAHPRWSRNLGTGDSITGSEMKVALQTIFHDSTHPSALILPVV
jgi:putative CocE/NonD family hydrolase